PELVRPGDSNPPRILQDIRRTLCRTRRSLINYRPSKKNREHDQPRIAAKYVLSDPPHLQSTCRDHSSGRVWNSTLSANTYGKECSDYDCRVSRASAAPQSPMRRDHEPD